MLRIIADENIPHVREAFQALGDVLTCPGRELRAADVREAEILLVRSVTPVDASLLANSRVCFVGSATTGTDHIDAAFLRAQGIAFANAPGSNADSVVEYILAALLRQAVAMGTTLRGKTLGIVGCGNIGSRLAGRLPALGLRVLQNDPPLREAAETVGNAHAFVPLETLLAQSDIVTVHTPLTKTGPHATYHLIDAPQLARMKPDAWLLNAARGPVTSNEALLGALKNQQIEAVMLDVWENEPTPDLALLQRTALATPHIAGYSYDGKVAGTIMLYHAAVAHFGMADGWDPEAVLAPTAEDHLALTPPAASLPETEWLHALVRQMYDLDADDAQLRLLAEFPPDERGAYFSRLRKNYPRRRTFDRHTLPADAVPAALHTAVTEGLRVQLV